MTQKENIVAHNLKIAKKGLLFCIQKSKELHSQKSLLALKFKFKNRYNFSILLLKGFVKWDNLGFFKDIVNTK